MDFSKIISILAFVGSASLALSPVLTTINPKYAGIAGAVSAAAAGLSARLTKVVQLPGGPVATGLGMIAGLALAVMTYFSQAGTVLDPALLIALTGIVATITAFGQSIFGWGDSPLGVKH